jgi:transcriptional regulator with XRE-family HTH domain
MTGAELALAIGKSRAWLAQRENGHRKMHERDRRRIQEALRAFAGEKSAPFSRKNELSAQTHIA